MKEKQFLRLLNQVWGELQQPDLVWQLLTLVGCVVLAAVFAHWWRRQARSSHDKLRAASSRLAFPLAGALAVAIASELLAETLPHRQLLSVALPLFMALAGVRLVVYILRQSFRHAAWLTVWERWVAGVIWLCLALYITDLSPLVIEALDRIALTVATHRISLWVLIKGGFTVALTLVVALWIAGIVEARLMKNESLDTSLRIVSVRVTKAVLTVIALLSALSLVGIDITALSVFTGALGVGLGLGLQKIASNYVAGFIILLERSIRIGNVVQVGAETGKVTEITTRYTVLKNLSGVEYIVPNETLVGATVQNQSYSDPMVCVTLTVGVAYDTDLDHAFNLLEVAAATHPRVLSDPAPKAALVKFGESAIDLELAFWVNDPELGLRGVRSDIALAVWRAFKEARVVIPVPQREVRILSNES